MVLSRSLAGANSGCSFKVDSYQRIAFSNSSWVCGKRGENDGVRGGGDTTRLARRRDKSQWTKEERKGSGYHRDVDVGQSEVVHHKVRRDLHGHAGDGERVLPQPGVLEDVGQADEGHVLVCSKRGGWGERNIQLRRLATQLENQSAAGIGYCPLAFM